MKTIIFFKNGEVQTIKDKSYPVMDPSADSLMMTDKELEPVEGQEEIFLSDVARIEWEND